MNKNEIEMLLKKGILGLISEDGQNQSQSFMDQDIDTILNKNTHIANYSLVSGAYTF